MSLIAKRFFKFVASASTDVTGYNVRVVPQGTAMAYSVPADTVALAALIKPVAPDTHSQIELDTLPHFQNLATGQYDVGLTAINAAGDESDFLEVPNTAIDTVPPAAPTDGSVS